MLYCVLHVVLLGMLVNAIAALSEVVKVPEELASDYIARTFLSISHDAMDNRNRADGFSKLVKTFAIDRGLLQLIESLCNFQKW